MDPQDMMQQLFKAFSEKAAAMQSTGLETSPDAAKGLLAQAQSALQGMQADLDGMAKQAQATLDTLRKPPEKPTMDPRQRKAPPPPAAPEPEPERFPPGPFVMVKCQCAREVCARYTPSHAAMACLAPMTPREFFDILIGKGLFEDAREFLAYGLGPRQRMLWTALSVAKQCDVCKLPSGQFAAMRAALVWALDQNDENRRSAGATYEAIGATTPAGNIALSVFASGGSLAPPGLPVVAPPPAMMPRAILAAQRLILNGYPLDKRPAALHTILVLGCQFALLTRPLTPNATPPEGRGRHAVYDHLRALLRRLLIELDLLPESPPAEHSEAWEKEVWEDLD